MEIVTKFRQEKNALWEGGKGPSLVVIASGWGLLLGTRMIYPVLLPYLRSSFDLSLTVSGLLITVLWLGSAVGQLPGGILADRYSERLVMAVGPIAVALALLFVVTAPQPIVLFAATGLVGLGQSLYPIARITILSEIYPGRIGSALGVTMATGDLGQTVFPPIAGLFAAAIAWQLGLGFMIPLLILAGILVWRFLPSTPPTKSTNRTNTIERARYVLTELRQSNLLLVAFVLFLYMFIWQSFTGLYPTYLVEEKGLSSSLASVLFSLFFAFGVVVKPLSGGAYDRLGIRRTLVIVFIGPVVGFVLLPFVQGFWALTGVTCLVSIMLGSGAITQSFLSDFFPGDMRGTGLGVVRTSAAVLGAAGPVVFGGIADSGYFDEGYILLGTIMFGAILLTLRLPQS